MKTALELSRHNDLAAIETSDVIQMGKAVVEIEMAGLNALCDNLDESFADVVDLILNCDGRVILSGMGKSGHIAGKITATLASTGTPAFFVHSSEASHGDLGMISNKDVVILMSNSGDTAELVPVIHYCKNIGVKIVAITSGKNSMLGRAANITLMLPYASEACAVGMAPTTSTTMMLCLGDALAVTLMRKRGFTRPNFLNLHPGGKLGLMLMPVDEFMASYESLPLVFANAAMDEVILEITSKSFGIAAVVDDNGRLVGSISDGDLRRNIKNIMSLKACEVMNDNPVTVDSGSPLEKVVEILKDRIITAVFVTHDDKPLGLVHMHHLFAVKLSV